MKRIDGTLFIILIMLITNFADCHAGDLPWYASGNGGVVAAGAQSSTLAGS